ncbi:PH domain-containing protein [Gottfriedia acidiceleris]|uniref:PH domain-containing protein n=1 Tax=Gottfriedia acidiceleris TaxID=371036 RepID=A0ABY4JMT3_9BACI|nr:PH domain-containing protein [Gottfriedia acidiceleris]UPM55156.1 PH domain-containing protein [Gottfriedia acidiceleris]
MKFKVKKNPLLVFLILSLTPIIISIPIISFIEVNSSGIIITLVFLVFLLPILIVLVWAIFHTYHELTETEFKSKFGFITILIPYSEIRAVNFSNNPVSSPAWTFKRLKIEYKKYGFALLSLPKDEEFFLQEIKKRCPNATILNRQKAEVLIN